MVNIDHFLIGENATVLSPMMVIRPMQRVPFREGKQCRFPSRNHESAGEQWRPPLFLEREENLDLGHSTKRDTGVGGVNGHYGHILGISEGSAEGRDEGDRSH